MAAAATASPCQQRNKLPGRWHTFCVACGSTDLNSTSACVTAAASPVTPPTHPGNMVVGDWLCNQVRQSHVAIHKCKGLQLEQAIGRGALATLVAELWCAESHSRRETGCSCSASVK